MSLDKYWPKWPQSLSKSGWDKQKGIIAKAMKGETGIGAMLQQAEKAFDDIKAAYFSDVAVDSSTKIACGKALKLAAQEAAGPLKVTTDKLEELRKLAHEQAIKFKSSPLIPSSSRKYVEQIEADAKKFSTDLRGHCLKAIAEIQEKAKTAP